jgi:hypothetical protein
MERKKSHLRTSLKKLPFPYFIAAEFVLSQSARKFTLPHLMVGITFAIASVLAFRFGNKLPVWALVPLSLVIGTLSAWWVFRLFRLVLPCLGKLVAWGVLAPPDQLRLDQKVESYLGRGTVGG